MLDENGANGVNGIMSRQTLARQACHRANNRLQTFSHLILDDGVKRRVSLRIRNFDASLPVIRFRELNSLLLV